MAKKRARGSAAGGKGMGLMPFTKQLRTTIPPAPSARPQGASVNADSTRSKVAPYQKTLGPRTA